LAVGVAATGTNISYQWYQGTSGNTANPVYGNTTSITVNPLNSTDYWVKVTGLCGASQNSNTAHVSVCTTPVIDTQPVGTHVFSGQPATLTVAASEATSEPLHYQWFTSVGVAVGSDSPTFTTPPMTQATQYYVHVTAAGCSVDSNLATVDLCTLPPVITTGTTQNVAIGQTVTLSCVISPGTGNTFTWYAGPAGDVAHSVQISSNNSYSQTFTAATSGGTYWATVSRTDDGCLSRHGRLHGECLRADDHDAAGGEHDDQLRPVDDADGRGQYKRPDVSVVCRHERAPPPRRLQARQDSPVTISPTANYELLGEGHGHVRAVGQQQHGGR